ncbi:MarR family winged helix-turn-helix transcriptional regulator [Pseudactinotalea suaedae]|uniref:MarR family winged helix-turn-helix transcriptional regulator n=1 Tax=Pseudactinotalea suaedae TaxID=1524924 RepID=UPI001F5039B0|nr:MarR family transcriptional regulator [Pseudactinotalea suaedae]
MTTTAERSLASNVTKAEAWRAYFETTALLTTQLEKLMKAESGLDFGDFNLLLVLSETPGQRLRLGELAKAVAFGPGRLTYRIDQLVRRGLVERRPCPEDRRGFEAVLTPEGHRALRRARPLHARHVNDLLLDHLTDEQAQMLLEVFGPLRSRLTS